MSLGIVCLSREDLAFKRQYDQQEVLVGAQDGVRSI